MRPWIRSLPNSLPKRPLRDDSLAQNKILSARKAPAGRFSSSKYIFFAPKAPAGPFPDLRNITKYVSWYIFGFDICNLKLFAIQIRLSIVPSIQNIQIIQCLMILMSRNDIFKQNVDKYIWPVLCPPKVFLNLLFAIATILIPTIVCGTVAPEQSILGSFTFYHPRPS